MKIPTRPWTLVSRIYRNVLPAVHYYLDEWKEQANQILNLELRQQSLMSEVSEVMIYGSSIRLKFRRLAA